MPSPLAHGSLVLLARAFAARHGGLRRAIGGRTTFFLVASVVTLCVADVDFLLARMDDRPFVAHGGVTHSLAAGLLVGSMFAVSCRLWYGRELPMSPAWALGTGGAWSHAFMDMATWGTGGVLLLWPLSAERYATVPLFFGARHSQPTAWRLHLVTLSTELLFVVALWWLAARFRRRETGRDA